MATLSNTTDVFEKMGIQMRDTIKTALRNPSLSVVYRALNSYVTLINQHDSFILRAKFCGLISWSVPDEGATEAIKGFVEGGRILEVGAGNGLYSVLLNRSGVYCKPTDNYGTKYFVCDNNLTEIEKLDETQAITKYGDYEVLMMIWPPPSDPMACKALKAFKGNKVIYAGENEYGCTADYDFFQELDANWVAVDTYGNPQFNGFGDSFTFYRRRTEEDNEDSSSDSDSN